MEDDKALATAVWDMVMNDPASTDNEENYAVQYQAGIELHNLSTEFDDTFPKPGGTL